MKVYSVLLIIVFSLTTNIFPQVEFTSHTITTGADGATSVYAVDVDSDGDIDVLSASYLDAKIAWYKNDGNQNFTPHTITTNVVAASSVYAVDVDGDGDMDVLSAGGEIAWYENDGNENFTSHTINTVTVLSVYAVDLDGDGDMDVLSNSVWYENDGNENFTPHTISSAIAVTSVYAIDVDGDGDMDVLSASYLDAKIAWYKNDGNQNFTPHTITTDALTAYSVYAVDVDDDGDMDVLSASTGDDKIAWYENDGNENFTPHTITTGADRAETVFAVDVDGDGDMDVLSASTSDNKIAWYENDGNENFTPHTITRNAIWASSVYAADVDGDGDIDVLSSSRGDDKIAWYENLSPPIPVELTSFTANVNAEGNVLLNWTTATEISNQMFEIQRKKQLGNYFTIGYVNGHGTTTELQEYSYTDRIVEQEKYYYRLKQIDFDGSFEYSDEIEIDVTGPLTFSLEQNYPNPFNPSTIISYGIPVKSKVVLKVFDVLGKEVATLLNEEKPAGQYSIEFNAKDLPSGIYFYKLQAGSFVETKKMILIK